VKRLEVAPGIHWIKGINGNCYLLADNDITLIDTGLPHKTRKILGYISNELHRKPSDLKTIILTHCHVDHIGNARELRNLTGARIAAHEKDAEYISGKKMLPGPKGIMRIIFKLGSSFMKVQPFQVDLVVRDGDKVASLTVVHVPGHTPGSIALYDSKKKALFTGDTLRYSDGKLEGPPKKFTMDSELVKQSIEKLKSLEFGIMLGGHGEPLTSGASVKVREFTGA
jgi:glyoxylase-like metal-dependent hydrolase (beta-lactamase superfamily II)